MDYVQGSRLTSRQLARTIAIETRAERTEHSCWVSRSNLKSVANMMTKEYCKQKYMEYKDGHQGIPLRDDFLRFAKISKGQLGILYGRDAYTKLQNDCGDQANKWSRERTPRERIMRQYGDLALELKELPNSSDWIHRRLTPSITGLNKQPHYIKWSEFPSKFQEWVEEENITGYEKVLDFINESAVKSKTKTERKDVEFERVLRDIRLWSPGRRRNSEGESLLSKIAETRWASP